MPPVMPAWIKLQTGIAASDEGGGGDGEGGGGDGGGGEDQGKTM